MKEWIRKYRSSAYFRICCKVIKKIYKKRGTKKSKEEKYIAETKNHLIQGIDTGYITSNNYDINLQNTKMILSIINYYDTVLFESIPFRNYSRVDKDHIIYNSLYNFYKKIIFAIYEANTENDFRDTLIRKLIYDTCLSNENVYFDIASIEAMYDKKMHYAIYNICIMMPIQHCHIFFIIFLAIIVNHFNLDILDDPEYRGFVRELYSLHLYCK